MTTLNTRRPTGAVPWPLILIEGAEKSGKSWACAELSASEKVGRTLWLDISEGAADEYGAVSGARYEVIEHDGSWASIMAQVTAAKAEAARAAAAGEPPVVLVIDSATAEWELLKDWAGKRASSSPSNRKRLADDPGAEVKIPMNLWNDATSRHRRLMTMLMTFPGIVVMTARGKEVAALDAQGKPVEGTKEYKVEGHKTLAYDASVWVRLSRERPPVIIGARSVHAGIRPGTDQPKPVPAFTLEWLVFDVLRCDPRKAHARDLVEARPERTPEQIRDEALETTTTPERIRELHAEALEAAAGTAEVMNETGDQEALSALLRRVCAERGGTAPDGAAPRRAARQPERRQPAPAPRVRPEDQGAPRAGAAPAGDETAWVQEFSARLAGATPDDLGAMQREIGRAVAARMILPATAGELSAAVQHRRSARNGTAVPA